MRVCHWTRLLHPITSLTSENPGVFHFSERQGGDEASTLKLGARPVAGRPQGRLAGPCLGERVLVELPSLFSFTHTRTRSGAQAERDHPTYSKDTRCNHRGGRAGQHIEVRRQHGHGRSGSTLTSARSKTSLAEEGAPSDDAVRGGAIMQRTHVDSQV